MDGTITHEPEMRKWFWAMGFLSAGAAVGLWLVPHIPIPSLYASVFDAVYNSMVTWYVALMWLLKWLLTISAPILLLCAIFWT